MNGQSNVLDVIRSLYYKLSPAEQKVASYALANYEKVQFMSISELSELSEVADATVTRFCRSLDLKGFNVFKIELAKCLLRGKADLEAENDLIGTVAREGHEAIDQTVSLINLNELKAAIELIDGADRVMCAGVGGSMLIANECAYTFTMVAPKFIAVADPHAQIASVATMKPNDVVLLFSYSGATKLGIELVEAADRHGVKVILVTRFHKSPMAKISNVILTCGSNEAPYQMGSIPAKIAQLTVIDVLFREYCKRHERETDENVKRVSSAISEKHI